MKSFLLSIGLILLFVFLSSDSAEANKTQQPKKTILITSFEAFAGRDKNNSALVSEELKRLFEDHPELREKYSLDFIVLPVQARVAAQRAREYVERMHAQPDLVLSLGESSRLAEKRKVIEINFSAQNVKSSKISANDYREVEWDTSRNGKIYPNWHASNSFNLPVGQMYCNLNDVDKRWVSLENNIGSYVCNDTAFDLSLYFKDEKLKEAEARSLIYPQEQNRKREIDALNKESEEKVKLAETEVTAAINAEKALRAEIDATPHLKAELPRLFDYIDSEKRSRDRYNSGRSSSSYSSSTYKAPTENIRYDSRTLSTGYKPFPTDSRRSDDFGARPSAPPPVPEPQRQTMLPQKLLDYKAAMEHSEFKQRSLNGVRADFKSKITAVENRYSQIIGSIQNIVLDSYIHGKKPLYGFIHIPILGRGEKTNPLDIAQVIALMIKGSFENNFPNANVNYNSGQINCGIDQRYTQTPAYQKVSGEYQSINTQKRNVLEQIRSKLALLKVFVQDEFEIAKMMRKSPYKEWPEATRYLQLSEELKVKDQALQEVVRNAPQAHVARTNYFSGHEKYEAQGTYNKEQPGTHLLKMDFTTFIKEIQTPPDFDLEIKTDSRNNIVLLVKDEHGRQQTMDLSSFENSPLTLINISQRSSISLRLDHTKSYSGYELRRLKASGAGTYRELNSKVEYWMNLDYTFPYLASRSVPYQAKATGYDGKERTVTRYRNENYWTTQKQTANILLKYEGGKWVFYENNERFNALEFILESNAEGHAFVASIRAYDVPIAQPLPVAKNPPQHLP